MGAVAELNDIMGELLRKIRENKLESDNPKLSVRSRLRASGIAIEQYRILCRLKSLEKKLIWP